MGVWAKPTLVCKRPIVGGHAPPRNFLKNGCSEMRFLAFWDTILTVTEPPWGDYQNKSKGDSYITNPTPLSKVNGDWGLSCICWLLSAHGLQNTQCHVSFVQLKRLPAQTTAWCWESPVPIKCTQISILKWLYSYSAVSGRYTWLSLVAGPLGW